MVSEGKSGRCHLGGEADAEAVLNLLSEEVSERCYGARETHGSSYERVRAEKRGDLGNECYRRKKKNVGLGSLECSSKRESQSIIVGSREEGHRRREEKEASVRIENRGLRKEGSSCSSYYSLSSLGDSESNTGDIEGNQEAPWERRKKSEKKLAEVSIERTESMEETSEMDSKVSQIHESGFGKSSGYRKQFHGRGEKLTVAGNLDEETRKQYGQKGKLVIGQSESGRKYQRLTESSEVQGSDVERTSGSQKQFSGSEENVTTAKNLVQGRGEEHGKKDAHITVQDKLKRNSQQFSETSRTQEVDVRNTSTSLRQSGTTMKNWNENSTSFLGSVQETKGQQHQTGEWITGGINSRRNFQQFTEISDIHDSDIRNNSISQTQYETRMNKQEGNWNLVSSSHPEAKEQHLQTDKTTIRRNESRKGYQDATSMSVVHASTTETGANPQRTSEKRVSNQEVNLTSVVKSVEETRERYYQADERLVQTRSREEVEKPSKQLHFIESAPGDSSSSQASLNLVAQARVQQIAAEERDKTSSQATLKPPPFQSVERGPLHVELTSGFAAQEVSGETPESGFSASSTLPPTRSPTWQREPHGEARRGETYGEPLNVAPGDVLASADRLEKSSMHFVGEFVEKVRHDVFTSEIQKERGSSHYGSENLQLKEHDSRRSSGASGTKGPSDEMWDVANPSLQEPPKTEAEEGTTTTGTAIVRRTGRSFWSVIADIVRMRWVSHSETHNSAMKSGGRSSSNESAGSDAWFSGREPDEHNDENAKREKRSVQQESISNDQPQLGKTPTLNQGEGSQATSTKDQKKHAELDMPSSSILESGLVLKSNSSASGKESLGWYENAESFQGSPSSSAVVESALPTPGRDIRRSPTVEEISSSTKPVGSGSGSMEGMDQKADVPLTEMSGTEGKDGELKRRKLQRNKQVLKDQFDEWEEAYVLENEQRKIDEMFMREALLEAKKAANAWEVPVGAVLVQHGKIIARGCNRVEELRDSTAHAEMICIREASNLLRTWRLSETTLYVTLEPCPMCAGAILQARIDTLVWGAPNKLLGADGSWIRLFPNGGEGGSGSELTDKTQAPAHPFHPKMTIRRGVLASECSDAMQQFFQLRRKQKEKKPDMPAPPSCLPISNHPSKFMTKMHGIFHMFCL
ncbi:unnamed protein product, partial [Vitis vinifera]